MGPALTHVSMKYGDSGWKHVTAEEAETLFPKQSVPAGTRQFICECCGQYVSFTKDGINVRHFKHSRGEEDKTCEERVARNAECEIVLCVVTDAGENTISVQAFKNNFKSNLLAFDRIYPLEKWFVSNIYQLTEEVYSILLKAGIMYHKTNRLCSCNYASCQIGNIRLLRGDNPLKYTPMSGGGQYVKDAVSSGTCRSAEEMFCLYGINGINGENITVKASDSLVYVSVPKADTQIRNILMLYSWATSDSTIRAVSVDVWPSIENILCDSGYHISHISD